MLQVHTGIDISRCQVQILQAGEHRPLYSPDVSLHSKGLKKPSANLFVVFLDSTHLQVPTYKTHYTTLNSHHISKLCLYLFIPETEIKCKINKNKTTNVYRGVYLFVH